LTKNTNVWSDTWNLEKITQLEEQLSWMIEQLSGLQAENDLLKETLSGAVDLLKSLQTENEWLENDLLSQKDKVSLTIFSDAELWISFKYPNNWWTITKDFDINNWNKYLIMLLKWGNTFFVFHNWGTPSARWWFWWDSAININNISYINNFCKNKTNCTIKTNSNWVQYVKYNEEYFEMWNDTVKIRLMYYIFNPNSIYRWIIMSNERISGESEFTLDNIVDSLLFL
jgi:hypothetical protein